MLITESDLPRGATPQFVGTWEVCLSESTFTVHQDGQLGAQGTLASTEEELRFTDESGPLACDSSDVGVYGWVLEGDKLELIAVSDACQGRRLVLSLKPLTRADD